jgi:hypothetical protein
VFLLVIIVTVAERRDSVSIDVGRYGPFVQPSDGTWMIMEQRRNDINREKENIGENTAPVPLCPPQIPQELAWSWTWSSAVKRLRLTAWAMARPEVYDTERRGEAVSTLVSYSRGPRPESRPEARLSEL